MRVTTGPDNPSADILKKAEQFLIGGYSLHRRIGLEVAL